MAAARISVAQLVTRAESPETPADVLHELAQHRSARVRASVAQNPVLDNAGVTLLAADESADVRLSAATNAEGRPDVEHQLVMSSDRWVRAVLAHTYADRVDASLLRNTQVQLVGDEFREVRERIAETTEFRDLYELLMSDPDPRVRGACGGNLRMTWEDCEALLSDRSWVVRAAVVSRGVHRPTLDQLVQATKDPSAEVRWQVLYRAGTPIEVSRLLIDDPDQLVRDAAQGVMEGSPTWEPSAEASVLAERRATPRLEFLLSPRSSAGPDA